ncbi:MAG: asparagine synthase (glutamine-hydrolyzing) [Polyangiaceae bacterium]
MCGIAGVLLARSGPSTVEDVTLERFCKSLHHRGPDGSGRYLSENRRAGLAHTRLAIVDLTETGNQPMVSPDRRFWLVFNGEIYNYVELRRTLEAAGHEFVGHSDTEVLLHLFMEHGIECVNLLDGMFAFAVYDTRDHELWIARDHMGEKPLYYVQKPGLFAFASEVRALVHGGVASAEPSLEGIHFLLRQGSIPPPFTHLRDVRFLSPATWCRIGEDGRILDERRYWTIPFVSERDAVQDPEEAVRLVRETLAKSVSLRGRADVPVGAFLSGGVDSTAVCATLIENGYNDVRAFTISLPNHPEDEAVAASTIAKHLGIRHDVIPLDVDSDGHWLDEALAAMDVPSIDGPNTWLVSRAVARAGLKVACSGLGGDELFFGYPSFRVVPKAARLTKPANLLRLFRPQTNWLGQRLPAVPRLSRAIDASLVGGSLAALWFAKRGLFSAGEVRRILTESAWESAKAVDPLQRVDELPVPKDVDPKRMVSYLELSVYMHDQLLRDTDAMSMAHGLEVRVPLIARPMVELVGRLGAATQSGPQSKWILRQAIAPAVPVSLLDRPKRGFSLDWQALYSPARKPQFETIRQFVRRVPSNGESARSSSPPTTFVLDSLSANLRSLV